MHTLIQDKLQFQHFYLNDLIADLPASFILKRHHPEKWSIHEQIAHLGRYQEIFKARIDQILEELEPELKRYKAEEDPSFQIWAAKETEEILGAIHEDRSEIIDQLLNAETDLGRIGLHPKFGALDIMDWIQFFLLHENHHHYAIFSLIHRNKK